MQIAITSILPNTGSGGLEVYFVPQLDEGCPGKNTIYGTLITGALSQRGFAHELGHACGLWDIYDQHTLAPLLTVAGTVSVDRLPQDWNNGPGPEEYYAHGLQQAELVRRVLMYGYTTGGVDIPAGTVYGLSVRTLLYPGGITVTEKNLMSVPVGLNAINCNPSHE